MARHKLDPGELAAAKTAVRAVANSMTYMGWNLGSFITEEQCEQVAHAVVEAVEDYQHRGER